MQAKSQESEAWTVLHPGKNTWRRFKSLFLCCILEAEDSHINYIRLWNLKDLIPYSHQQNMTSRKVNFDYVRKEDFSVI